MRVLSSAAAGSTAVLCLAIALGGCLDRDLEPLNPCTVSGVVDDVQVTSVDEVDLLFLVDDSQSMEEEQASLLQQLPNLVRILASGDRDGDGLEDFPPVRSLQIGVITSDMGTGGFRVDSCDEPNFGDDGILRTDGDTAISGCNATYPGFVAFEPESGADPVAFAEGVGCVASVGTDGCGYEQQLEAVLKAVTPSTSPIGFNMSTAGHADRENAGFLRPDSLLAVIAVTDEEDCSAADPELFNPSTAVYPSNPNLRCFSYPQALHPVTRYVDGLLATRTSPDLVVFAGIVGVPPETAVDVDPTTNGLQLDFQGMLDHPLMEEQVDTTMTNRLRPSCNVPGRGLAFPPRRIVETARALEERGSNGVIQSICQADFGPALDAIIEKIADVLGGTCLPRDLNPDDDGLVSCDVVELLPTEGEITRCDQIPGRSFLRLEEGAEVCQVVQHAPVGNVPPTEPGWFYDDFTDDVLERCGADGRRISFTAGNEPRTGTLVRLECLQPVQTSAGTIGIHSPCGQDPTVCDGARPTPLFCEPTTNTCQRGCAADSECPAGFRCNGTFCINPTCG